jgi:hypothetical protein
MSDDHDDGDSTSPLKAWEVAYDRAIFEEWGSFKASLAAMRHYLRERARLRRAGGMFTEEDIKAQKAVAFLRRYRSRRR